MKEIKYKPFYMNIRFRSGTTGSIHFGIKYIIPVLVIFVALACGNKPSGKELQKQAEALQQKLEQMEAQNMQLQNQMDSLSRLTAPLQQDQHSWYRNDREGKKLLDQGISDPENYIKKTLRQMPELIPIEPVLGGKMRYNTIELLGEHWLIAGYDDGHIAGKSLYRYKLQNGKPVFTIMDSEKL